MAKKGSGTRQWLMTLKGKKTTLSDIVPFAMLAFVSYKNAVRLLLASEKINDRSLKISLQILALEELSKPLFIYEICPALNEVFDITAEEIEEFINDFFHHPKKQLAIGRYGESSSVLDYKNKFTAREIKRLESIKQGAFYTEILSSNGKVRIPFDTKNIDKDIANKIQAIIDEKGDSLNDIYNHPMEALRFFVLGSIFRKSQVTAEWIAFLRHDNFDSVNTFEDLIKKIENFEQKPYEGKLYVDDESRDAGLKTMVLLIRCSMKKEEGQTDVVGISLKTQQTDKVISKRYIKINKLLIEEISKPKIQEKISKCIHIEEITTVRPSFIKRLFSTIK